MSNQKQEKTSEIANTKVLSYKEKLENKILEIEETLKKVEQDYHYLTGLLAATRENLYEYNNQ